MARGRRAPVKAFLLDQRRIAGVGNIYADEALFRAGIHPLRPAGSADARAVRRAGAARCARRCSAGLAAGGATIDDFRHADGVRGAFQNEFLVHLRRGRAVPALRRAGGQVRRRRGAGRTRASAASRARGAGALGGLRGELGQAAALVGLHELAGSRRRRSSPTTICGKLSIPVSSTSCARPAGSFARLISSKSSSRMSQQLLGALAERARLGRVDGDLGHYFTKYSGGRRGRPGEGPGGRPALAALRRGRPHPAPLYPAARQAWARSPRACGARAAASAGAWSRSSASTSSCTRAAATCSR